MTQFETATLAHEEDLRVLKLAGWGEQVFVGVCGEPGDRRVRSQSAISIASVLHSFLPGDTERLVYQLVRSWPSRKWKLVYRED
jgi:hypothetical protein